MTTVPEKVQQAYGQLPQRWRLEKLKFYASVRNSNVDKTISDDETPVRLCNYTDVYYNDRITPDLDFMQGSATDAEIEKFQLKQGQVIITKDSEGWDDIGIPALVTEDMPEVLCGYHLSVLEPGEELDGGFLAWLCRSEPLNDQFKLGANGVTRYGLGQYPMKNAFVALPPLETQRRIARFLDEKTARIDGLIEKKRALLERLAEKRQALITRSVTNGLNPDAPMRHSGIDWLGEIPAHWELKPIYSFQRRITYGFTNPMPTTTDGPYMLTANDIGNGNIRYETARRTDQDAFDNDITDKSRPEAGDVLITKDGTLGRVAVFDGQPACINQSVALLRVFPKIVDPQFLAFCLLSEPYQEEMLLNAGGTTIKHIYITRLTKMPVAMPGIDEQVKISKECSRISDGILSAENAVRHSISCLEDYRAAIITAAVTGNIAEL